MSVICNHDCFNCQYPDCINDEITLNEFKISKERDKEILWRDNLKTDNERQIILNKRAYNKAWYEANKERKSAYYQANKTKILVNNRVYYKAYYEANKEQLNARQRARHAALKQAKAANQTI